jgi:hypothetical protein
MRTSHAVIAWRRERIGTKSGTFLALFVVFVAGCASLSPGSRPNPADSTSSTSQPPPAANVNLRGFPVAFRQGYADGCESVRGADRRRDERRYKADSDYKMGWNDGHSICAARK